MKNNILRTVTAGLFLATAVLLSIDTSRTDNIPFHQNVERDVVAVSDFLDSSSDCDSVSGGELIITAGEGEKWFSAPVTLTEEDAFSYLFSANNTSGKRATFYLDLLSVETGQLLYEQQIQIRKKSNVYSGEVLANKNPHSENCELRIRTEADTSVVLSDLHVNRFQTVRGNSRIVKIAMAILVMIGGIAAVFLCWSVWGVFRNREKKIRTITRKRDWKQDTLTLMGLLAVILGGLYVLYRHVNIRLPLAYSGGDEMGIYYLVKTIATQGTTLVNPFVGGTFGGDMFDYPYSDKLSFLIVRLLALFTKNPYLITNLFYFLNFFLNGLSAYFVGRKLDFSRGASLLTGGLFAFCPFIQLRYAHMWLTPYYMLPVACLLAMNILQEGYVAENGRLIREKVIGSCLLAYLCAFTGMYYAFFTCALIAAAMVICLINTGWKHIIQGLYPLAFIAATVCGVVINIIPNVLYWLMNGTNPTGEIAMRDASGAETYALKLVQLILPRIGHRSWRLSSIAAEYARSYPLVNENMTASIGLVASVGLVFSLCFLFSRRNDLQKGKDIASLNLSAFLIATIGGIGGILSLVIDIPMRCYNRMSLVIAFLSLLSVAVVLDRIGQRHRLLFCIAVPLLLAIGFYDQTNTVYQTNLESYNATHELLRQVNETMAEGDMIFELPADAWPTPGIPGSYKQFIGYIETDGLHWSYGAMEGRGESNWQIAVAGYDTPDFLDAIVQDGYDGVYLDKQLYEKAFGEDAAQKKIDDLTRETGREPLVSSDGQTYFWDIREPMQ